MVGVVVLSLIVVVRDTALPASAATTHRTDPSRTQLEHAGLEASRLRALSALLLSRSHWLVACCAAKTGAAPTCAFWAKPGVEKGLETCEPDISAVISLSGI